MGVKKALFSVHPVNRKLMECSYVEFKDCQDGYVSGRTNINGRDTAPIDIIRKMFSCKAYI